MGVWSIISLRKINSGEEITQDMIGQKDLEREYHHTKWMKSLGKLLLRMLKTIRLSIGKI